MNVRNYSSKRVPGGTYFDSLPWQMGNDLTPIASECGATIGFTNPQFPTLGGSDANRGT